MTVKLGNDVTMELAWCPATTSDEWKSISGGRDSFLMGISFPGEPGHPDATTVQQHPVTLTKGFWIGKCEVTQMQWITLMSNNPSFFTGASNPVENISIDDCREFIARLNKHIPDGGFRLPTEAEWEYACRAGTTTSLNSGKNLEQYGSDLCPDMNVVGRHLLNGGSENTKFPVDSGERWGTTKVAAYRPNGWGIYDMHGNVMEWCQDWYAAYPTGAVVDPKGPPTADTIVTRGGCWFSYARNCTSSFRDYSFPDHSANRMQGFRLARSGQ